ncbi:3-isopropylmalate dehydratase [Spongiibacter sp. KMU-166]|uniref:3-isopropylmalate dehydratase n=1 Tax=Spongiibacter thalassae TaxID=2721624 RepID=A0ABX1GBR0_9GAMM|nr:aconitase family protein [Spongiibacter thalassae]NKI15937.1 3-isopropylmalate dehydratase [Spongiibacter thalassae]
MAGKNIVYKILESKSDSVGVDAGLTYMFKPDKIVLYDWPAISDWLAEAVDGGSEQRKIPDPERLVVFLDHLLPVTNPKEEKFHKDTRDWCVKHDVDYVEGKGIGHQVIVEEGMVKPGMLATHFDTHISCVGGIGALGIGIMKEVLMPTVSGEMWFTAPSVVRINLDNDFRDGVSGRDLLHKVVSDHGPRWGLGKIFVFGGEGAKNISVESRMVICNLANYFGAITALFEPDERTREYLEGLGQKNIEFVSSDPDAAFDDVVHYDLATIEPMIAAHPDTANIVPINELEDMQVDVGIIGTCASGRIEDLKWAAEILDGKTVNPNFKLFVVPTTNKIFVEALGKGYVEKIVKAGGFVSSPTCDYCYGKGVVLGDGQKAISTQTLNVPGRLGNTNAEIYLSNAAVVAATAIEGKITDPKKYL